MFNSLKEIYDKFNLNTSLFEESEKYEKEILDIFNNKNFSNLTENDTLLRWIGKYYQEIEKDYEKMKIYYLMAIEKGNVPAMNNLGQYYHTIQK